MLRHVLKVGTALGACTRTETLQILARPSRNIVIGTFPCFKFVQREELKRRSSALRHTHNRRNELHNESIQMYELGEVIMQEIDKETLDVRAVVVLVGHNHYLAV